MLYDACKILFLPAHTNPVLHGGAIIIIIIIFIMNSNFSAFSYMPRLQWEKLVQESIEEGNLLRDHPPEWPFMIKRAVGRILLNIIILSIKVNDMGT